MGFDSIELVMQVEKAFSINLPDKRLQRVQTVSQLHELVLEAMNTPDMIAEEQVCRRCNYLLRGLTDPRCPECGTIFIFRESANPEVVWDMLVKIVSEVARIAPEHVRPELNFVNDLT